MLPIWLIDFGFGLFCVAAGLAGGGWLMTRKPNEGHKRETAKKRRFTQDAVKGLQAVVESVHGCVKQHSDCLDTISAGLTGGDANDAAASIIEANQLAEHQFLELKGDLDARADKVRVETSGGLLQLTTLALDRQKHTYQKVLSSLESLAVEMAGELDGCGKKLRNVSDELEATTDNSASEVRMAITNLLEAVDELDRSTDDAEVRLEHSASRLKMQAILSHADLLTSLPNRRALEEQLERETATNGRRAAPCSLILLDIDNFKSVNARYGYSGGDTVLRQTAMLIKRASRGRDTAARFGGDSFALILSGTTLSQAMPMAERLRDEVAKSRFSEGGRHLSLTASLGVLQLQPGERPNKAILRATMAVKEAIASGGNMGYYHDGQQSFPISVAHRKREERTTRDDSPEFPTAEALGKDKKAESPDAPTFLGDSEPTLCGRSIFVANLKRRLAEWNRGGPMVSVLLMRIDQTPDLLRRHDRHAMSFLRRVLGRLLQAATRDMDQRCDYEEGVFAVLLPSADESTARAIAQRLRSQVLNCKLRLNNELWDLSASIGVADAAAGKSAVDVLVAAAHAMERAVYEGGDSAYSASEVASTRATEY